MNYFIFMFLFEGFLQVHYGLLKEEVGPADNHSQDSRPERLEEALS